MVHESASFIHLRLIGNKKTPTRATMNTRNGHPCSYSSYIRTYLIALSLQPHLMRDGGTNPPRSIQIDALLCLCLCLPLSIILLKLHYGRTFCLHNRTDGGWCLFTKVATAPPLVFIIFFSFCAMLGARTVQIEAGDKAPTYNSTINSVLYPSCSILRNEESNLV
ncbi:hypothetical protein GGS21DRAFT_408532 [Xylaria nigripes]|nr:hypothetical protein GGS21DRAFT_408532 [Xylaria nigripes]